MDVIKKNTSYSLILVPSWGSWPTTQKAHPQFVPFEPNYPTMWKEVMSAPWASKAAGGLDLLCDQRGWHPEWRGPLSWRKCLQEGSLCGVFAHHAHILPGVLSHLGLLHFSILWGAVRGYEQGAALAGELDCMRESSGCFKILIPWSHP